MENKKINLLF